MALADFNADQQPDLAVTNQLSNTVGVLLNLGGGSFGTPIDTPVGGDPYGIAAGALNGDGQPDLVVTNTRRRAHSKLLEKAVAAGAILPTRVLPTFLKKDVSVPSTSASTASSPCGWGRS